MKRIVILTFLLALPAQAQWMTGREQLLTSPTIGPTGYNGAASVAASDTNFLAAWLNRPPQSPRLPGTIMVMPFGRSGTEAPTQFALGDGFAAPGAGSNGSEYLLAWAVDGAITFQRLARDASRLGGATTVTASRSTGEIPVGVTTRVGWNGAHYVVVATSAAYANSVIRPSLEAVILDVAGNVVRNDLNFGDGEELLDAATLPGLTLVVSVKQKLVFGRYIDGAGSVSAPFLITPESTQGLAAVTADGTSFFAVWISGSELRTARIPAGGATTAATTIATGVASVAPAMAWNGRELAVAWVSGTTQFVSLSAIGTPTTEPLDFGPAAADSVSVAGANGLSAVVTSERLVMARVVDAGRVTPFPLSQIVVDQLAPRLVDGVLYYLEQTGGLPTKLMRQSANGSATLVREDVVDYDVAPGPFHTVGWVSSEPSAGIETLLPSQPQSWTFPADGDVVAVAASPSGERLLVFRHGFTVYFVRAAAGGELLDRQPVQLSDGTGPAPVAIRALWRGDAFVVEWEEAKPEGSGWLVKSSRIQENGAHSREVVDFDAAAGSTFHDLAVSDGVTALAVRVDHPALSELRIARVDPEAPSAGVTVAVIAAPRSVALFPVRDGFDVVWVGEDGVAWRSVVSHDFLAVTPPESLGPMPAPDVTFVYGESGPRLLLYSKGGVITGPRLLIYTKGSVIAARAIGKARRRAAAAP